MAIDVHVHVAYGCRHHWFRRLTSDANTQIKSHHFRFSMICVVKPRSWVQACPLESLCLAKGLDSCPLRTYHDFRVAVVSSSIKPALVEELCQRCGVSLVLGIDPYVQ